MCARVCARCNPIFRFNLFTPPLASLRPNLPLVVNTFARIPGPFCPGRARSPLQSPPTPAALCHRAHDPFVAPSLQGSFATASSSFSSPPISPVAHSLSLPLSPLSHTFSLCARSLSLFLFDNPTRLRTPSSLSPGFCEDPLPPLTEPTPTRCRPIRCTVSTPLYYGVRRVCIYTRVVIRDRLLYARKTTTMKR